MDDGRLAQSGFYFHTKGFTFPDVYKLAGLLHYNFGLVCTVQNHSGMPVIYITARSIPLFISEASLLPRLLLQIGFRR